MKAPLPPTLAPYLLSCLPLALSACDQAAPVERIDLSEAQSAAEMALTPSPDTTGAGWAVSADGKALQFGREGEPPYLSLACTITTDDTPPGLTVIRHAESDPGAKALFAVLGNGIIARLKLDATLSEDGWRWEGNYPASAPELDVFTGRRDIRATLPGAGMLDIGGSPLPGEFINWCRRNGEYQSLSEQSAAARQLP